MSEKLTNKINDVFTRAILRKLELMELDKEEVEVYRHRKGGVYLIVGETKHTETEEICVAYVSLDKISDRIWVRPKDMFYDGRFTKVPRESTEVEQVVSR